MSARPLVLYSDPFYIFLLFSPQIFYTSGRGLGMEHRPYSVVTARSYRRGGIKC